MKNLINFFKNMWRYLKSGIVTSILLLILLFALIGYFVNDLNHTYLIAIAILFILGTLYDTKRFIGKMVVTAIKYPDKKLYEFLVESSIIPNRVVSYKQKPLIERIVIGVMIAATIFMMVLVAYYFITGNMLF